MRNDKTVQLHPTVCIRCSSKRCRKKFKEAVKDLEYLTPRFRRVEVILETPQFATGEPESSETITHEAANTQVRNPSVKQTQQIQSWSHGDSACGLKLKTTTWISNKRIEAISTIGGVVKVDGKFYGLTTAHGIIAPPEPSASGQSSSCSSEVSTSESGSESSDDPEDTHSTDVTKINCESEEVYLPNRWDDLSSSGPACFCGQTQPLAPVDETHASNNSDFALIDMGLSPSRLIFNTYSISNRRVADINTIRSTKGGLFTERIHFVTEQEWIFSHQEDRTQQTFTERVSGAWVIQDKRLCGIVVAVYEKEPYVHMITIDKMFRDIRGTLIAKNVTLATREDISMVYRVPEPSKSGDSIQSHSSNRLKLPDQSRLRTIRIGNQAFPGSTSEIRPPLKEHLPGPIINPPMMPVPVMDTMFVSYSSRSFIPATMSGAKTKPPGISSLVATCPECGNTGLDINLQRHLARHRRQKHRDNEQSYPCEQERYESVCPQLDYGDFLPQPPPIYASTQDVIIQPDDLYPSQGMQSHHRYTTAHRSAPWTDHSVIGSVIGSIDSSSISLASSELRTHGNDRRVPQDSTERGRSEYQHGNPGFTGSVSLESNELRTHGNDRRVPHDATERWRSDYSHGAPGYRGSNSRDANREDATNPQFKGPSSP
ncbi:hypothetical protein P171DRAFT_526928 [Karstenula rhodostoma CBS 690.94]|uniref:Uncharacterized protein n=1 Tax=Karstenula rhodostoma CBS 690.94 TaxID=1392251 RepID=A0A9P4U555_9PLEO|nr:hypothetical protein P171DRAFT_526928 [Karstenula rhodostoma CBS 690.94]